MDDGKEQMEDDNRGNPFSLYYKLSYEDPRNKLITATSILLIINIII